jgi:hypothetical protein
VFLPERQKSFTWPLTGEKGWLYKAPIDAAADATGAKRFHGNRGSFA